MSQLFENYNTGDNDSSDIWGSLQWRGQTFTPATGHTITSVKLKLFRTGTSGTLTVGIRTVDGNSHPTGADLCSGTIAQADVTTTAPGLWYEITFGAGAPLTINTQYAIVCRAPDGSNGNMFTWRGVVPDSAYAGGCRENSADSGATWTSDTTMDFMFEDWGTVGGGAVASVDNAIFFGINV